MPEPLTNIQVIAETLPKREQALWKMLNFVTARHTLEAFDDSVNGGGKSKGQALQELITESLNKHMHSPFDNSIQQCYTSVLQR